MCISWSRPAGRAVKLHRQRNGFVRQVANSRGVHFLNQALEWDSTLHRSRGYFLLEIGNSEDVHSLVQACWLDVTLYRQENGFLQRVASRGSVHFPSWACEWLPDRLEGQRPCTERLPLF